MGYILASHESLRPPYTCTPRQRQAAAPLCIYTTLQLVSHLEVLDDVLEDGLSGRSPALLEGYNSFLQHLRIFGVVCRLLGLGRLLFGRLGGWGRVRHDASGVYRCIEVCTEVGALWRLGSVSFKPARGRPRRYMAGRGRRRKQLVFTCSVCHFC